MNFLFYHSTQVVIHVAFVHIFVNAYFAFWAIPRISFCQQNSVLTKSRVFKLVSLLTAQPMWRSTWPLSMPLSMFILHFGLFWEFNYFKKTIQTKFKVLNFQVAIHVAFVHVFANVYLRNQIRIKINNQNCQVAIHVAFVHAFVNPLLFLVLHPELRSTVMDILCCRFAFLAFWCRLENLLFALNLTEFRELECLLRLRNYGESTPSPSSPSETEKTKWVIHPEMEP